MWSLSAESPTSIGERPLGWRPVGCSSCGHSGYDGRMGLFEFLRVCEELQELIPTRPSAFQVARLARERGMIPMRRQGKEAVDRGDTTMEELIRALGGPEA